MSMLNGFSGQSQADAAFYREQWDDVVYEAGLSAYGDFLNSDDASRVGDGTAPAPALTSDAYGSVQISWTIGGTRLI